MAGRCGWKRVSALLRCKERSVDLNPRAVPVVYVFVFVASVTEGVVELVLPIFCLPGLEGKARGPDGTRTFSRRVLRLRWVLRLGRCSRLPPAVGSVAEGCVRVAEAGREGLRKVFDAVASGSVVVRWNLRRMRLDSAVQHARLVTSQDSFVMR